MNLHSLLNRSRFVGCVNPRAEAREKRLSLFCEECDDGAHLMMERNAAILPLAEAVLPPHLHDRVRFWNAWCSSGFNGESESSPSLFGLEVYAVSIGVEVLRCFPDCAVDWCGLPLHDDAPLLAALEANSAAAQPSNEFVLNRYATRLMRGDCPAELPPDCVAAENHWDWSLERTYLSPLEDADAFVDDIDISSEKTEPQWLAKRHAELCHLSYMEGEDERYSWGGIRWCCSPLLQRLLLSALAVDWARVLKRPVCTHPLYMAGEDVLHLCK